MKLRNVVLGLIISALLMAPTMGMALANVPGVALNAPPPAPAPNMAVQGGQGMIEVVVVHRDTLAPATHYVDHLYLFDGNNLIKEWKYTEQNANPNKIFSEAVMMPATKDMNLRAIAHCTLHGYSYANVYVPVMPAGTKPMQMVQQDAQNAGLQINGMSPDMATGAVSAQDQQLIRQLRSREMQMIQQHQMETTQFFQTQQGQKFLDLFDYTGKMGAGQAGTGQMMPGQQGQMQGQAGMAGGQQGQKRMRMQMSTADMQQGQAGMAGGQQGQQGQMSQMPGQTGMAPQMQQGVQSVSTGVGVPQKMWTDSMGNKISGEQVRQLGQAASQAQMQGQMGQGQMMPGQQGQQGKMGQMPGQMMPGQAGMAQGVQTGQGPSNQMPTR